MNNQPKQIFLLDGESLNVEKLVELSNNPSLYEIQLSPEAWERVENARKVITDIVDEGRTTYGINTGFGNFASVRIQPEQLEQLQKNLILSHAVGVGKPLTIPQTRAMLLLRLNVFAKGYSGISQDTLQKLLEGLNKNCLSFVPEKGSVGASGDLAPLSHLALGFLGVGKMWDPTSEQWEDAEIVMKRHQLRILKLQPKDGLALINGTQFITALGAEACFRASRLIKLADIVASLSIEALTGSRIPFIEGVQLIRNHPGQKLVAQRIRAMLGPTSEIGESHRNCSRVQDGYTLRCIPQVHGVVQDSINFTQEILNREMNSATDNPLVFHHLKETNSPGVISAGNFHGEYPAKACDYLSISIQEIVNISERRIERLCNPNLNVGLPPFLIENGGLNSGFMMAHVTAASLTSENKTLCFPASCDTISTSSAQEDHVSMGAWAARKALKIVQNAEIVIAIELLAACQGLEFRRPLKTSVVLEAIHSCVREKVPPLTEDRYFKNDIDAATELIRGNHILKIASRFSPLF